MQSKYRRLNDTDKLYLNELWSIDGLSINDMQELSGFTRRTIRMYFQRVYGKEALSARRSRVHSLAIAGEKHPQYRGGRKMHKDGYVYILQPYDNRAVRYVLEHRLVMKCPRDMVVHHCDGVRHNNCVSNLVVMNEQQHNKLHLVMGDTYWNKESVLNWLETH